ncbi:hypothetical protein BXT84_12070 [Sulfobacillus thermotolerans]|uniref:Heavy metal-binding domain-containing protein n=1 Tax=Sulfobacillus thermotolerans TaxID=338644 RepID=A0ABM6RTA4_9FIRM|nr:hypothetical protein BXT84_12070 [Sulfobacillus thermotolerans]
MPLFRRPPKPPIGRTSEASLPSVTYESQSLADVEADQEALAAGDLPRKAKERLNKTVHKQLPWMSTYSAPDFYLTEHLQLEPVAQVSGACYFHASTDSQGHIFLDSNMDASNLVRAYYRAKDDALTRLSMEATAVGAHAVLNARYRFHREGTIVSFTILGTAVRFAHVKPPSHPLISPLSGEETYKLLRQGWLPVGMALGYHWHCMPVGFSTKYGIGQSWYNQEFTSVSRKLMDSRSLALRKMRQDATQHHGVDGLVGVKVDYTVEETEIIFSRGSLYDSGVTIDGTFYPYEENGQVEVPAYNTEFFATGASVVRLAHGAVSGQDIENYLALS